MRSDDVEIIDVPGAFELPFTAALAASTEKYAAIVALGCVIQGDTDHHTWVAAQAQQGLGRVALDHGIPVIFGVLTCATEAQALQRAGLASRGLITKEGENSNKGAEAALAALRMLQVVETLTSDE